MLHPQKYYRELPKIMVTIPFSLLPPSALAALSDRFMNLAKKMEVLFPYLQVELDRANLEIKSTRYLAGCLTASTFVFLFLLLVLTILFSKNGDYFLGPILATVFSLMIIHLQLQYPKVVSSKRVRKIDAELLTALRTIMIQLNAGVTLFEALVCVAKQDFGEISYEFKRTVNKINAGVPQIEALEEMALRNPSAYFRRVLWQIINGMKEGATIAQVIASIINSLTKEQIIQIEKYGSQLNPLTMFYMMGAVIMPALGITFLLVISSFIQMDDLTIKAIFGGLFVLVLFIQIMFTGTIKAKRPSLLGD